MDNDSKELKLVIIKADRLNVDTPFTEAKQVMMQKQDDGSMVLNVIMPESSPFGYGELVQISKAIDAMGYMVHNPVLIQHTPKVDKLDV